MTLKEYLVSKERGAERGKVQIVQETLTEKREVQRGQNSKEKYLPTLSHPLLGTASYNGRISFITLLPKFCLKDFLNEM